MKKELPENNALPNEEKRVEDEILEILHMRTKDPGEAFVVLQQLSVFLWASYKIDWKNNASGKLAETREGRYLDYLKGMLSQIPSE